MEHIVTIIRVRDTDAIERWMRRLAATALLSMAVITPAGAADLGACATAKDLSARIKACDAIAVDKTVDAATRSLALVSRGYAIYARTNDTNAPLASFTNATVLDPKDVDAYVGIGSMHLLRKETDQAETAFKTALKLDPKSFEAWKNLGTTYDLLGNNDKALASYDKALAIDKRNPNANLYKADTLLKMGKKGEALAVYRFTLYLFDPASKEYAYAKSRVTELENALGQN